MRRVSALVLAAALWSCGEALDELTPYVAELQKMDQYNETLSRYAGYLKNPALERQARDIGEVMAKYQAGMEAFGQTKNKYIKSGHNLIKRALARGQKQIVEPDFPTFTVSAQKQINLIKESVQTHHKTLKKLWEEAGKTEPFPIVWPE